MKKIILSGLLFLQVMYVSPMSHVYTCKEKLQNNMPLFLFMASTFAIYQFKNNQALHQYLNNIHQEDIDMAYSDIDNMKNYFPHMALAVHGEKELEQNVQLLGLKQHNALEVFDIFNRLQEIVASYNSWFKPWCWTSSMKIAAYDFSKFLKQYQMYKSYFITHQDCLRAWHVCNYYQNLLEIGVTDHTMIANEFVNLSDITDRYYLLETVRVLKRDIAFITSFLQDDLYKDLYPCAYQSAYILYPVLKIGLEVIQSLPEYLYQKDISEKEYKD